MVALGLNVELDARKTGEITSPAQETRVGR
jgi:hypothetical protein